MACGCPLFPLLLLRRVIKRDCDDVCEEEPRPDSPAAVLRSCCVLRHWLQFRRLQRRKLRSSLNVCVWMLSSCNVKQTELTRWYVVYNQRYEFARKNTSSELPRIETKSLQILRLAAKKETKSCRFFFLRVSSFSVVPTPIVFPR